MNNRAVFIRTSLFISLLISGVIVLVLTNHRYHPLLIPSWFLSLLLPVIATYTGRFPPRWRVNVTSRSILILLCILLPVMVRILCYQPDRIHGDDLLTASFSMNYHPRTSNFFAGVPESKEWVAKFPVPYFLLQKIFLRLTGATILTVKLSVLPYVLIVSAMTYRITAMLMGPFAAISAVILYAFMAISIYHETLGLHFISSTAAFLVFFYTLLHAQKYPKPFWFAASGVTAAACYLSYTSSYIAFPILLVTLISRLITHRSRATWAYVGWAITGFCLTIAPFFAYAIATENYFVGRISQVSLLTGSWSVVSEQPRSLADLWNALVKNLRVSLLALVRNGIGGHGGYTFSRQAFFHPTGYILFIIGLGHTVIGMWKSPGRMLIVLIICITFITGMVLTIPPPAYHRVALAFPFLAIISATPFALFAKYLPRKSAVAIAGIVLAVYAGTNIHYFQTAVQNEATIADAAVIRYINAAYPNRHVHIAAYPSFALEKLYPFFIPNTATSINTQYHNTYLSRFNLQESYVYVITFPDDFQQRFISADPRGSYIPFSEKYGLFVN